jgi:hypothetical protein
MLTDAGWESFATAETSRIRQLDVERRHAAGAPAAAAWSERERRIKDWVDRKAPTTAAGEIDRLIDRKLKAARIAPTGRTGDLEFLRRLSLDTSGQIPTVAEIRQFMADPAATRRVRAIDRFLARPGWADHWVSYWQDVLAENPGILKPDLNNTGPFRWWLHQSFEDNLPFDRIVADLIRMEGSAHQGGPAGFGMATLNDAPMAAKGHILAQAFLGENLGCARCHDAPHHPFRQRDLFSLAAMLDGKPVKIPATSTVVFREGARRPNVQVTSRPGEPISPAWSFVGLVRETGFPLPSLGQPQAPSGLEARRTRSELASLVVAPENERFSQVLANRVWKRYMGRGIVEPVDDWNRASPSNPELLQHLAREFVRSGHDLRALARLIFTSDAYQRKPAVRAEAAADFAGPTRRRMAAEQVVDSLFLSVGKKFDSEELNLNPIGDRPVEQFLNLGAPCRAWEFTALSNERDRPALALPISQGIVDVLTTFGWRQSRQSPASVREEAPSPMQTLLLANGNVGARLVRLSDDSALTELALRDLSLGDLVRETFLRILSRPPTATESKTFETYAAPSFAGRRIVGASQRVSKPRSDTRVSWSNHLSAEATEIRMAEERRLRLGDVATARLTPAFRERFEDVVWALMNSPEFVLVP